MESEEEGSFEEMGTDEDEEPEVASSDPEGDEEKEETEEDEAEDNWKEKVVESGKAVRNQLRLWDNLLCLRIRFQKVLVEANKLPQQPLFEELKDISSVGDETTPAVAGLVEKSYRCMNQLTDSLLDLQELMMGSNSEVGRTLTAKVKTTGGGESHKGGGDASDPMNEEITSSEDESPISKTWKMKSSSEQGNENQSLEDESDEEEEEEEEVEEEKEDTPTTSGKKRRKQRRKANFDYDAEIKQRFNTLLPFRNETIEKWNSKTEIAFGKFKTNKNAKNSNFSSFQISALKQVTQVLSDTDRLVRRTQLKRSHYFPIGESESGNEVKRLRGDGEMEGKKEGTDDNYNKEIFDDDDFYHQLLREVIERKTSNSNDPAELNARWIELQKIRGKSKKKVDTKSSKGRKIRFAVLPKLVNFMAPRDECPMTENAYKELLNTLFSTASMI